MLEAGEDPRFIARRLVILASEDVGNADPQALLVAIAAMQAVEFVGLPECQLNLAQAVTYLATAPKSNASYLAINKAREDVRAGRTLAVPQHLRDTHYKGAEALGHGEEYEYSHDHPGGWVDQRYLPEERRYYEPVDRGHEAVIRRRMEELRRKRGESPAGGSEAQHAPLTPTGAPRLDEGQRLLHRPGAALAPAAADADRQDAAVDGPEARLQARSQLGAELTHALAARPALDRHADPAGETAVRFAVVEADALGPGGAVGAAHQAGQRLRQDATPTPVGDSLAAPALAQDEIGADEKTLARCIHGTLVVSRYAL